MIDISAVLSKLHPDLAGWEVINNEITKFPDGVERPTQKDIEKAWREVERERKIGGVRQERKMRYEQETDELLFDALESLDMPELKDWQKARKKIKLEIPH